MDFVIANIHYVITILIIVFIVVLQLVFFQNTKSKINKYAKIFPEADDKYKLEKDVLIDEACSKLQSEIIELQNSKNNQKKELILEVSAVEICDNEQLKKRLSDEQKSLYLNIDGNFKPYKVEEAKNAILYSLNSQIQEVERNTENEISAINNKIDIARINLKKEAGIFVSHHNSTLKIIVDSINDYLKNNKSVSDFHLLKDIVDRNCDIKEDEISTQIPIPLYLGLVGTMAGILIGIMYLWLSGGIKQLLSTSVGNSGADGVEALLGGVALAMISSIIGILLTTWQSNSLKTAQSKVENSKHQFFTWIQKTLLPTLSDNVVGAIREMTGNLDSFNQQFAKNTGNLSNALDKVNESYVMQVQLLDSVRQLANKDITQQNLQLYTALHKSSGEIGKLAEYLNNCNQYLENVQSLNTKLDDYENRTKFIENASKFYSKHENWLAENYDDANRKLVEVVNRYNTAIEETFNSIKSDIENKRQEFGTFIDTQNSALVSSTNDLEKVVNALNELGEVQKSVRVFESAIRSQNAKIDSLSNNIEKLASVKANGGAIQINQKLPKWQIVLISIIALSCTIIAAQSVSSIISDIFQSDIIQVEQNSSITEMLIIEDSIIVNDSIVLPK